jgi:hypothetical protein
MFKIGGGRVKIAAAPKANGKTKTSKKTTPKAELRENEVKN